MLLTLAPILTFWTAAITFHMLGWNSKDNMENPRNLITVRDSIRRMAEIDVLHIVTTLPMEWGWVIPQEQVYGYRFGYLVFGIFLMDTIQYFVHRLQHKVPWLFKYAHSGHHSMRYSWSFGSLYNNFYEVLLTGSTLALFFMHIFKFTFVEFQIVTSLATFWTVIDHTEAFNNVWWLGRKDFHRIHHSVYIDCNFQQPFMTFWDVWLGTDYDSVMRKKQIDKKLE